MTCIGLNSDQGRVISLLLGLQFRGKLKTVGRYHPVVMVTGGNQSSRIGSAFFYIMHRGISFKVVEHFLAVFSGTVIISPTCTGSEGVVTQHIHHAYGR